MRYLLFIFFFNTFIETCGGCSPKANPTPAPPQQCNPQKNGQLEDIKNSILEENGNTCENNCN